MAISGTYFIKMWLPDPKLVHGPDFQPGPPAGGPPPTGSPTEPSESGPLGEGRARERSEFSAEAGNGEERTLRGRGGPGGAKPQVELKDYGQPSGNFFEGEMTFHFTPNEDGTLSGDADGSPINFGYYTGDEFFKVDFPAGPGRWEVWARVDKEGYIEGMISVGGNKGFPNFVYGKKLD